MATTSAAPSRRALPFPVAMARPVALVERNLRAARHYWLTFVSGFFEPVFYLFAMGVGIGALVGSVEVDGREIGYAVFVAPAMMATSAMNGAVYDSTGNVFYKLKHSKLYRSVLSTPLRPWDIAAGEISWALLRGLIYSAAFLLVAAVAGFVPSVWALLAIPACTLIGLGFAAVGMAATTYMRSWNDMDYVQLAILPMFLFSATFYPLATYPPALQWVVQAAPLYHGVDLVRALTMGDLHAGLLVHVAYLAAFSAFGLLATTRRIGKLLLT
ncbi:ABC transporter permease [Occultella kanbiaonis]|uniref:ABC transporter permease n=1 Tax=Occultella kanbiaonis TaxID=2675754 RepID=UPI001F2EE511|nr:ABC transporter permease [Occultella kanbiaonis]